MTKPNGLDVASTRTRGHTTAKSRTFVLNCESLWANRSLFVTSSDRVMSFMRVPNSSFMRSCTSAGCDATTPRLNAPKLWKEQRRRTCEGSRCRNNNLSGAHADTPRAG